MHLCLYTSVYMHCVLMYAYLLVYIYIYICKNVRLSRKKLAEDGFTSPVPS